MPELNPAESLLAKPRLSCGWTVIEKVPKTTAATGGNFSVGYIVVHKSGKEGFLKALDFSKAMNQPNSTMVLQNMTTAFNYEKKLLEECKASNLDRVAVSLDDGQIPAGELHTTLPVPYLIFELADGDIRNKLDITGYFDLAFSLRALHHCATGINQLHSRKIAHQDLKPSNVLFFNESGCRVADLGTSAQEHTVAPFDDSMIAGDPAYAPPELLYREISSDWRVRRLACDLYHLGSLAAFFFTRVGMTAMWLQRLDPSFRPNRWGQSYRDVLPYVRNACDLAIQDIAELVPRRIRDRLVEPVRQLCEPDPILRGHPKNKAPHSNPYSLERYVTRFDLLAHIAEWQMRDTYL